MSILGDLAAYREGKPLSKESVERIIAAVTRERRFALAAHDFIIADNLYVGKLSENDKPPGHSQYAKARSALVEVCNQSFAAERERWDG
jgi:hypothetical protein